MLLREPLVQMLLLPWDEVETDWRAVKAAVDGLGAAPLLTTVRDSPAPKK